jgi:hypothetical protein
MGKLTVWTLGAVCAVCTTAAAQNLPLSHTSPQHLMAAGISTTAAEREGLYAHAAGVVARAGVASPDNGPLSREELLSILMLMSLQQAPATHAS